VEKAYDTIPVRWTCQDPEGDPKTISLLISRRPTISSANIQLSGYENLNGSDLEANVITSQIDLGAWVVIARAWDGGAQNYAFSPGVVVIYKKGDLNFDGVVNIKDWIEYSESSSMLPGWVHILDFNRNGTFDPREEAYFYKLTH
jgi:hypothetical protein